MNAFAVLVKIKWNQGSSSDEKTQVHLVDSEKFIIGRGVESSIVLPDPSISRKHLGVLVSKGTILLKDLSSNNITYIDGQKTKRGEVYSYRSGQSIRLGTFDAVITVEVIQKVLEPSEVDFDGIPTDVREKFNNLILAAQHIYQDNEKKSEQLGQKIIENNTREGNLYIEEAKAQAEEILKRCEQDATRMIEDSKEKEIRNKNEIVSEAQRTAKALFDEASMYKEKTINEANHFKKTTIEETQSSAKRLTDEAKHYSEKLKMEADESLLKTKDEVQRLTFEANELLNKTRDQVRVMSEDAEVRIKKIREQAELETSQLKIQAQEFLDQARESNLKASLDSDNALREANLAAEQIFKTKKDESEEHAKRVISEAKAILAEAELKAEKISNETVEISRKFAQEKADKIIAEAYKAADRLKEDLKKQYEENTSQRLKEIESSNRKKEEELRNDRQKWITERDVRDKILNQEYEEKKQQYLEEHRADQEELDRSRQTLMDLKNKLTQNELKNKEIEESIDKLTENKKNIEINLSKLKDEHDSITSELKIDFESRVAKFKTEYELLENNLKTEYQANTNKVQQEFSELNKKLKDEHDDLIQRQTEAFRSNEKEYKDVLVSLQNEIKKTREEAESKLKDGLVAIETEHADKLKDIQSKHQIVFDEYKEKVKQLKDIQFDITEASRNIAAYRMQISQLEQESQNAKSSLQAQIHSAKESVKIEQVRMKQEMEKELHQLRLYEREKAEKEIKDTLVSFSARKEKFALRLTQDLEGLMANFLTSSQTLTDPQNVIKKEVRAFVAKAFDENYIELSRVLDKDVKMEVAQLSEARRIRIKTWAVGVAAIAVVYYILGPMLGVFDDKIFKMTNERGETAQQEFTREQREIKEAKKFVPTQTADWKGSFVDNFIYTIGFYEAQSNKDYENDWIRKLYRVFVKELKMDDEVVARLVGIERSMFSRLEEEYKVINPDFVDITITKMRSVEEESNIKIKDILKTDAKLARFERERKEFWQPRLEHRVPASKEFDEPRASKEKK